MFAGRKKCFRAGAGEGAEEENKFFWEQGDKVDLKVQGQKPDATLAAVKFPIIYLMTCFARREFWTVIFNFTLQNPKIYVMTFFSSALLTSISNFFLPNF